jgi:hypothetical protein
MLHIFSQGSCTTGDLYRTRKRTPVIFLKYFSVNSSAIPTARLANLYPEHKCPLPAAI